MVKQNTLEFKLREWIKDLERCAKQNELDSLAVPSDYWSNVGAIAIAGEQRRSIKALKKMLQPVRFR